MDKSKKRTFSSFFSYIVKNYFQLGALRFRNITFKLYTARQFCITNIITLRKSNYNCTLVVLQPHFRSTCDGVAVWESVDIELAPESGPEERERER